MVKYQASVGSVDEEENKVLFAPYTTKNPSQTRKLGEKLAKEILTKKPKKTAFIIGLEGELGSGKTTFLQGFARGLGIKQKILSPTFVIMKRISIPLFKHPSKAKGGKERMFFDYPSEAKGREERMFIDSKFKHFYHVDCYRVQKPKEILTLGFKEIISNPKNIVAIEWAERIKKILPVDALFLKFEFVDKLKRKIVIKSKND